MLFNIVLGFALYKNYSESTISIPFIGQDLNKTINEVEAHMQNEKESILETVNEKLNENNIELMRRIHALESVTTSKDVVSVEVIYKE